MVTPLASTLRLIVAFVLGGLIGLEREKRGSSAGLRTHILVSVGSALIMITSIYLFNQYRQYATIDPGRIAAGVVTGIGFLGGGTIIRSAAGSRGLTTAASIWVSAAIGLAVGCGFFSASIVATVLAFITLSFLKKAENMLEKE